MSDDRKMFLGSTSYRSQICKKICVGELSPRWLRSAISVHREVPHDGKAIWLFFVGTEILYIEILMCGMIFVGHVLVMCGVIFAGHVWGDFCWPCVGDVWGDFCW